MKSESREEAAARMRAMSEDEKKGMRQAQEGILAVPPTTEESERRARRIDKIGEAQNAVLDEMSIDAGTTGGAAEAEIATDTGRDEAATKAAPKKSSAKK